MPDNINLNPHIPCQILGTFDANHEHIHFYTSKPSGETPDPKEAEFLIDNLLVRIHSIIEMIWWTGLAPWEFQFPFPGSFPSTSLA